MRYADIVNLNHKYSTAFSFFVALVFVLALCLLFEPQWQTNDDAIMSMVAHGYGIAETASVNLVFSNVIWGYFVQALPDLNRIQGYSIATYIVLFLVCAAWVKAVIVLQIKPVVGIACLLLIFVKPVLFPQFTVNAGLLVLSSIVLLKVYQENGQRSVLWFAFVLAFTGYIVRSEMFMLMVFAALPLVDFNKIKSDKYVIKTGLVLLLCIVIAIIFDIASYQDSNWSQFMAFNNTRVLFTDYFVGEYLKHEASILDENGFSPNDINLIREWFFVHLGIEEVMKLNSMVASLGVSPFLSGFPSSGFNAVKALFHIYLLPGLFLALLAVLTYFKKKLVWVWLLVVLEIFIYSSISNSIVFRMYYPLIALLVIAPVICKSEMLERYSLSFKNSVIALMMAVALLNTANVFVQSAKKSGFSDYVVNIQRKVGDSELIVWAGDLPYQKIYPVLGFKNEQLDIDIYGLNAFTLAPYTVSAEKERLGQGFNKMLTSEKGLKLIASNEKLELLDIYCHEYLKGKLTHFEIQTAKAIRLSHVRCTGL